MSKLSNVEGAFCGILDSRLRVAIAVARFFLTIAFRNPRRTVLLKDMAEIITAKIVSDRDGYWRQSAQDSFVGFALLLLEYGQELTFENIQNLFNGCKDRRDDLLSKIGTDSESYRRLATILLLDSDITYGCVVSEFNSATVPYLFLQFFSRSKECNAMILS